MFIISTKGNIMSKKILFMVVAIFSTLLISFANLSASEPGEDPERSGPDSSLYFRAGYDTIFVAGTTQSNDTIAIIPIEFKCISQEISDIEVIRIQFNYDESLELIDAYMDSTNWNGTFSIGGIGTDSIILLESGSIDAPGNFIEIVYLKFRLDCAEELTAKPVTLNSSPYSCSITYDGKVVYAQLSHIQSGAVVTGDYDATFTIESDTVSGGLGLLDTLTVLAESNFRIWYLDHYIIYDTTRLEYISFWAADSSLWDSVSIDVAADTIHILFFGGYSNDGQEYQYADTIYNLVVKMKSNPAWDGYSAELTYDNNLSSAGPKKTGIIICDDLSEAYDLINGEIFIPQYQADLSTDFACDGCDGIVSKSDLVANLLVGMSNNFPAGLNTDAIIVNLDLKENIESYTFKDTVNDSIDFELLASQNGSIKLSISQIYRDTLLNFLPASDSFHKLFTLKLDFDPASFTPTDFDDDEIYIGFDEIYTGQSVCTTMVYDTTGSVKLTVADSTLNFIENPIQVLMGEFSVDKVTGGACSATQNLYVRNTFDLDTFSIQVHSPDLRVEINSINNGVLTGVSSSKVNDYTFNVYSNSNFSSISDNGDDYTKVAEINYTIDGACYPYEWIYIIPELSNKLMKNGDGDDQYVVLDADTLAIYCQACGSGGQSKLASDEGNSGLLPTEFNLYPCRPNPFNPSTDIAFDVPVMCPVTITIYNILGQEVTTLVDREMEAGRHSVVWNSTDKSGQAVSSGIYLCVMRAGDYTASQKMSLMK